MPEGYTPSKIIVATDGAVTNTGIAIYIQSKAQGKPTVSNLLCAFTFISKFSIPVNEAKGMTQGTERLTELLLVLAIRKEFQRYELEIDFIADSSCCLALLNPYLNINNRTIRNMVQQIRMNITQAKRIFPNAIISFYWIDSESNPSDIVSKLTFRNVDKINSNLWRHGPIRFLTSTPGNIRFYRILRDGSEDYSPPTTNASAHNCLSLCPITSHA